VALKRLKDVVRRENSIDIIDGDESSRPGKARVLCPILHPHVSKPDGVTGQLGESRVCKCSKCGLVHFQPHFKRLQTQESETASTY
jgi:hypothetical protein